MGVNMMNYGPYSQLKGRGWSTEDIDRLSSRRTVDAEDENEPDENEPDEDERDEIEVEEIQNSTRKLGLLSLRSTRAERSIESRGNVVYVPLPIASASNVLPLNRIESASSLAEIAPTRSLLQVVESTRLSEAVASTALFSNTTDSTIFSKAALTTQPPLDRIENTGLPILATPQALPGANQKDPFSIMANLGLSSLETSVVPSAAATTSAMGRLLPGANQPDPVLDGIIATPTSIELLGSSQSFSQSISTTEALSSQSLPAAVQTTSSSTVTSSSTSIPTPSSASLPRFSITTIPNFSIDTLTKSFLGKEAEMPAPNPTTLGSTTLLMSTEATSTAKMTPMSITSSASAMIMSTSSTLAAVSLMSPTAVPQVPSASSIDQNATRSRLSPVARMVLIAMGILGALAIVILLIVVIVIRKKKAAASQATQSRNNNPFDYTSHDSSRVTTWVSANTSNNDNPFLSAEEKARRGRGMASSRDSSNAGERLQEAPEEEKFFIIDAVSSFVAKTRRLTYKITP